MLNPYLNFNGNAREAMEFYQSVLGGELKVQTLGEAGVAKEGDPTKDRIMHALLKSDDMILMASDAPVDKPAIIGNNIHLSLQGFDEAKLSDMLRKLSEGGKVHMPLQKAMWGDTFGMLTDKFAIHWMVNIASPKK